MTSRLRRAGRGAVRALLVFAVHAYRVGLAPHLGPCCRYVPSCSAYALEALDAHGPWRGTVLAVRRVLRCHPFRPGGYDPVPEGPWRPAAAAPRHARRMAPAHPARPHDRSCPVGPAGIGGSDGS